MTEQPSSPPAPPDLGAALAAARKKRKESQEDAAKALRLPPRLIAAMEENRPEDFPAPVYYRGSVQNYCEYLDLDFESLWRQANPAPPPAPPSPSPGGAREPGLPQVAQPVLIPAAIFGLLLIAAGVVWLLTRQAPPPASQRGAELPKLLSPLKKSETVPAEIALSSGAAAAAQPARQPGEHRLEITPLKQSWVHLHVDKKLVFEGELPAGRTADWQGRRSFAIRTQDPAALHVTLDGKELHLDQMQTDPYGNILIPATTTQAPDDPAP